jgi:WD40 repeat protein
MEKIRIVISGSDDKTVRLWNIGKHAIYDIFDLLREETGLLKIQRLIVKP